MGRASTRTEYTDMFLVNSADFKTAVGSRNHELFKDWIGGMTGHELAQKYYLADITVRQTLTKCKQKYEEIQLRRNRCDN